MPKLNLKRIKSAPKRSKLWDAATFGIALTVVFVVAAVFVQPSFTNISINSRTLRLENADTEASREKGLGGRAGMSNDQGMLFIFDRPAKTCFWMKGMRFPLDIVWLDSDRRVVTVYRKVSPASYPRSFCPSNDAKYVIELNAGQAQALGVTNATQLSFQTL